MPDGVIMRPFDAARIPEIVSLWNAAAGDALRLREALFRQNTVGDPQFDPEGARLACDGSGGLVGCVIAKVAREPLGADGLREDRGWISFLAVHPSRRRRGVGAALVRAAEAFLRLRKRPRAVLGADPDHFFPGVPDGETGLPGAAPFFEACGYTLRGEAFDLYRALDEYRTPEAVAASLTANPDLEVRPLTSGEAPALLRFLDAVFPGRWRYTVARFLERGGPAGDVMGVIRGGAVYGFAMLFHPGSRWIGPSIAWPLAGRGGVQAGPGSGCGPLPRPLGGLGPMGVAPELRGRGLGLALVDAAARRLAGLGVRDMVIDWTILLDFYGRVGFAPCRRYRHGERTLTP
jgi:predicted N-acetyltransferase YhbS